MYIHIQKNIYVNVYITAPFLYSIFINLWVRERGKRELMYVRGHATRCNRLQQIATDCNTLT